MAKYLLVLLFLFSSVMTTQIFTQENDSTETEDIWEEDSTESEEIWDDEEDSWKDDWNFDFDDDDYFDFEFSGKPYLELNYGMLNSDIKSSRSSFSKLGMADVKLGYSTLREYDSYVVKYRNRFIFLSNLSQDYKSKDNKTSELAYDMWRFGLGTIDGYGYSFGKSAVIPYTSNSFVWSRMELKDYPSPYFNNVPATRQDSSTLNLFNESFRFGTTTEAGLKIQLIPLITLNAGFERNLIFPRHLFWKHLGSMAVEWIGLGAVEMFTREVMDSSPAAGPIINFLLKNAVSFGMYQLRREKMNWPFKSAEPLAIDTWKMGITFTF